jgi:hypothetical protein
VVLFLEFYSNPEHIISLTRPFGNKKSIPHCSHCIRQPKYFPNLDEKESQRVLHHISKKIEELHVSIA